MTKYDLKLAILSDFQDKAHIHAWELIIDTAIDSALEFFETAGEQENYDIVKSTAWKEQHEFFDIISNSVFKTLVSRKTPLFWSLINSQYIGYELTADDILDLFAEIDKNADFIVKNIENMICWYLQS